jgi:hypothetical protein
MLIANRDSYIVIGGGVVCLGLIFLLLIVLSCIALGKYIARRDQ